MAQANEPDAWDETFLITIQELDGTAAEYRALISTYDITGGDKDFTTMANAAGGRVKKFETQTEYEVTLEGYATQVGDGEGFFDLQNPGTADAEQPLIFSPDHSRSQYLLSIMHTTNASATSAVAVSVDGDRAMRDTFKNGHFVSVTQSFTDRVCKFTIKFKSAPFNKGTNAVPATANVTFESTDGESAKILPAITYTS